jgi:cytochrome c553
MIKTYLLYIIIALTALQSVDAVADAAKYHQPNSEFTEVDFFTSQSFTNQLSNKNTDEQASQSSDSSQTTSSIDHCCYCHGISTMLPTGDMLPFGAITCAEAIHSSRPNYLSLLITPDLRPPIV